MGTKMVAKRQFASCFHPRTGESLVTGATFFGGLMIFAGLVRGEPALFGLALIPFAVALHNYPMSRQDLVQLLADEEGLWLDGLGLLPWSEIQRIDYRESYIRNLSNATLEVITMRPWKEVRVKTKGGLPLRGLMAVSWRNMEAKHVRVRLQGLKENPPEIREAVLYFFRQAKGLPVPDEPPKPEPVKEAIDRQIL